MFPMSRGSHAVTRRKLRCAKDFHDFFTKDPTGLEAISLSVDAAMELRQEPSSRAAFSGAVDAQNLPPDPGLETVIAAWPSLPERGRQRILRLLKNYA